MSSLKINRRLIMTPGPVAVDPRVSQAMSNSILGQFDPEFTNIMNETMDLIRDSFKTDNKWSYPIDGTSRAGIEAAISSIVEPGDKVLIPVIGRFGNLLIELVERAGAEVHTIVAPMGEVIPQEDIIKEMDKVEPKVLALIHGETSSGRSQPIDQLGKAAKERGVFTVVDAVATYMGQDIPVDEWELDAVIGGSQKCLSVPSGITPITYNDRFSEEINKRKRVEKGIRTESDEENQLSFITSNYLDLTQLEGYWSNRRLNHHTEATVNVYGLYEGLKLALAEGVEQRAKRHSYHHEAMKQAVTAMGLEIFGDQEHEMQMVVCVNIPEGVEDAVFRNELLERFGIEIAGTFGAVSGKIWRIGTMGYVAEKQNLLNFISAFGVFLESKGVKNIDASAGLKALIDFYDNNKL
ncbi:pyridoxal-phosphate-dependent aminotransferase family protein [Jeotgalicoccus marinus]|uniref:pyridoxal-phosphate-dependent aminotransferase family protein n=1 Tax=Jeotgalicoccus marinus TaxID=516700 RepID=UPI00040137A3|nr:alanine--glyoxylate aminotransferase family protein [Jeotgalicoccus marinus]